MMRVVGVGFLIGMFTATAMAGDCSGGGRELGAPVPNLTTPGYFEPGAPETVTVKNAKLYRSIHLEGARRKIKEFVAVREGRLVALVHEFPPDATSRLLNALQSEYGTGKTEDPDYVPDSTEPPIGFAAKVIAQQSWDVPRCGFAIRYIETISPTAVFGVTTDFKLRTVVWTKASAAPPVDGPTGVAP